MLKKTAKFITLVQNSYMLTLLIFPQYSKKIPDVNHRYLYPIYGSISKSVKTRYVQSKLKRYECQDKCNFIVKFLKKC